MNVFKDVIGIVGGMGSYATLNIYKRILDAFEASKEWERPRIIIDNLCTLPSRSKAILYHENYEIVIEGIADSIKNLINSGATIIILSSNTSYILVDEIYNRYPEFRKYVISYIELLSNRIKKENLSKILLLGTSASMKENIYQKYLNGIDVFVNNDAKVNDFIESVKQNKITEDIKGQFVDFINNQKEVNIILGCTELPVLYESIKERINKNIYDPMDDFIDYIKNL